jgi:diaminopimelate decarboxylase
MRPFDYRDGTLHAEAVPIDRLAAEVGTPFYLYSGQALEQTYRNFAAALGRQDLTAMVCYAVKANPQLAVIRSFARLGAGADVVSEGELRRALAAGVPGERIVFAGVGKTEAEMALGLETGILQFNVESREELIQLDRVAAARGTTAPVALRINPNVDARTHAKITTGRSENKFGIDIEHAEEIVALARELPAIRLVGLAVHIGSQLVEIEPYAAAFRRVAALYAELRSAGEPLQRLDLGGGLGITYRDERPPEVEAYAAMIKDTVGHLQVPLVCEPGRHLVGNAGLLITRVLYVKQGTTRRFVIVDAAMNDLIRPTLYEAWHDIQPVRQITGETPLAPVDVVGPICESGDFFAMQRPLPPLNSGDLIAIFSAGAYGATMSSTYNSRLPAPEVMVHGEQSAVIKARQSHEALLARESVPAWLETTFEDSRGAA